MILFFVFFSCLYSSVLRQATNSKIDHDYIGCRESTESMPIFKMSTLNVCANGSDEYVRCSSVNDFWRTHSFCVLFFYYMSACYHLVVREHTAHSIHTHIHSHLNKHPCESRHISSHVFGICYRSTTMLNKIIIDKNTQCERAN